MIFYLFILFFCFNFENKAVSNGLEAKAGYFVSDFEQSIVSIKSKPGMLQYRIVVPEQRDGTTVNVFSHPRYYDGPFIPLSPHSIAVEEKPLLENSETKLAPYLTYQPQHGDSISFNGGFFIWSTDITWHKKFLKIEKKHLNWKDCFTEDFGKAYVILYSNQVIPGQEKLPPFPNLKTALFPGHSLSSTSISLAQQWLEEKDLARQVFTSWDEKARRKWMLGAFHRYLLDAYPHPPEDVKNLLEKLKKGKIAPLYFLSRTEEEAFQGEEWADTLFSVNVLSMLHENYPIDIFTKYSTFGSLSKKFLKPEIEADIKKPRLHARPLCPPYLNTFSMTKEELLRCCEIVSENLSSSHIILNPLQRFLMLSTFKCVNEIEESVRVREGSNQRAHPHLTRSQNLKMQMQDHFKKPEWQEYTPAIQKILEQASRKRKAHEPIGLDSKRKKK